MKKSTHLFITLKKIARVLGICMALPFFIWVPLGLFASVPSIIDVFGMDGIRYPTSVVIGGLMLAAFGFDDF